MGAPKNKWGIRGFSSTSQNLFLPLRKPSYFSLSLSRDPYQHHRDTFHALLFLLPAIQENNRYFTNLGITQKIPNQLNISHHNLKARLQCSRIWSTYSPATLHKWHQLMCTTFLFLRYSAIKINPLAAHHIKKDRGRFLEKYQKDLNQDLDRKPKRQ